MCVTDAAFEAVNKLLVFNLINLCSVFNTGAVGNFKVLLAIFYQSVDKFLILKV